RVSTLPATLRGLVAARLDALPSGERAVLDDAAVLGRRGPVAALVALGEVRGASGTVRAALGALAAKELVDVDEPYVEFRSDLVREVAYGILTKAERARRHASVAAWVGSMASETERTDEFLETLARHHFTAAELSLELGGVDGVPDDIVDRALVAVERAAERAEDRELHLDSHRFWDQAVQLLGDDPSERRRHALIGRGRGAMALRRNEEAHADLSTAIDQAREAGDQVAVARALTVEGELLRNENRFAESLWVLEEALAIWRDVAETIDKHDAKRGEASALRRIGMTHLFTGDTDAAEPPLVEAHAAFQEIGSRKGVAWANQNLAWISFMRGDNDEAEERLESAVSMFHDIGDWGGLGWAKGLLAWVYFSRGMLREAEELAREQLADNREQGDRWGAAMMTVLLASAQSWQGRITESVEALEQARQSFVDIADRYGQLRTVMNLMRGLQALGQREEAELLLLDAEALVEGMPESSPELRLPELLAIELAVQRGDGVEAMRLIERLIGGLDGEQPDPSRFGGSEVAVNLALALAMVGRPAQGVPLLVAVARNIRDVGPAGNVLSALALVAAAAGDADEARARAGAVASLSGGSYLDHTIARLALACVSAAGDDEPSALAALSVAEGIVGGTDDALTKAIVLLARGRVLAALGHANAEDVLDEAHYVLTELGTDAAGWDAVFRQATGAGAEAAAAPA
ncbi:MAG TPA: tetratricopeptide repeat protein, partial [Acidimicrobiales bacterium]|nr:tetratricopeptide repeat protein [Acidimicrobiales bacterium]